MSITPLVRRSEISFAKGPSVDAFGRLRTSQPVMLLDSKQVGGTPQLQMATLATGDGTSSYNINRASTFLTIPQGGTGTVTRSTRARAVYQPGKSIRSMNSFVFAPGQAGLIQEVGRFDAKNGVLLRLNNTTASIILRSFVTGSAVDTEIQQANWNIDKLDGTGPSGVTIDLTKAELVDIDSEWLGTGDIRYFMVIDGFPVWTHTVRNANVGGGVTMSNPNLPLRWRIEATAPLATAASLESICGTIMSEGGYDIAGVNQSVDTGDTTVQVNAGGFGEILCFRMKSAYREFATAVLHRACVTCLSGGNFIWRVVLNPTVTATPNAWVDVNAAGSIMEWNRGRTVTEGTGTRSFGEPASASANQGNLDDEHPVLTMGSGLTVDADDTDVLSLQVRNLSQQNETYAGSLTWREAY